MSGGDSDDRDGSERPRKSWREIDRARDGSGYGREERGPRGRAAEARARQATREYLKRVDGLFAPDGGGAEGERLARAVREAHGTPELAAACAAYREGVGLPADPALLALFLDAGQRDLVLDALRALAALRASDAAPLAPGLRSQLRMLAEDPDDEVAEAAEDALDAG